MMKQWYVSGCDMWDTFGIDGCGELCEHGGDSHGKIKV